MAERVVVELKTLLVLGAVMNRSKAAALRIQMNAALAEIEQIHNPWMEKTRLRRLEKYCHFVRAGLRNYLCWKKIALDGEMYQWWKLKHNIQQA